MNRGIEYCCLYLMTNPNGCAVRASVDMQILEIYIMYTKKLIGF